MKDCIDCKYSKIEDLYDELVCEKKGYIHTTKDGYNPACNEFEPEISTEHEELIELKKAFQQFEMIYKASKYPEQKILIIEEMFKIINKSNSGD